MPSKLTRENCEAIFREFAKDFRKHNKSLPDTEIVIVGGGSILLNYTFREITSDFDAISTAQTAVRESAIRVAEKYNLPDDWINDDFAKTVSYSDRLREVSKHFRTYNNGSLEIRTVNAEYLIAMKLMSHREYKHDLSDIVGILHDEQAHGNRITADKVFSAVDYLYGDSCKLRDDLAEDVRAWCGMDRHALEEEYRRMNDVEYATRTEVIRISAENESMHRKKTIDEIIKEAEQKAKQSTKDKTTIPPKPSLDELIKEAEKKAAKKAGKTSWDNDIGSRER